MTRKYTNSKGRTAEALRATSRRLLTVSLAFGLCFGWFYLERRSERAAISESIAAMESGQAMGGRSVSQSELRYARRRDGALVLLLPITVLLLGLSALRRLQAGGLEHESRGESDRG